MTIFRFYASVYFRKPISKNPTPNNIQKRKRNQPSPNLISDVLKQVYSVLYFLTINAFLTSQLKIGASNDGQHSLPIKYLWCIRNKGLLKWSVYCTCSITLWNAVGNGSVTVSGSFENHAMGIRSHKAAWNHSLTLGQYEPDSAMVWLYNPWGFPGLILMSVPRQWELFNVFRVFPTNFALRRVTFFSPPVICGLYWTQEKNQLGFWGWGMVGHQGQSSVVQ